MIKLTKSGLSQQTFAILVANSLAPLYGILHSDLVLGAHFIASVPGAQNRSYATVVCDITWHL